MCFVVIRHLGRDVLFFLREWHALDDWKFHVSTQKIQAPKDELPITLGWIVSKELGMNCQSPFWHPKLHYQKTKKIVSKRWFVLDSHCEKMMSPLLRGTKTPPHHLQNLQNCCEIRTKFTICPTWLAREFLDPNGFLQPKPKKWMNPKNFHENVGSWQFCDCALFLGMVKRSDRFWGS